MVVLLKFNLSLYSKVKRLCHYFDLLLIQIQLLILRLSFPLVKIANWLNAYLIDLIGHILVNQIITPPPTISWLSGTGVKTAYIEPGSPWKKSFCYSFNSNL